ncbi:Hypp137 [Branchiostoma lanceolatum]|nr:Hypp137 [Branchiostoma lanceolatum]
MKRTTGDIPQVAAKEKRWECLSDQEKKLLRCNKNKVSQIHKPGLHPDVLKWMDEEAQRQGVTERGRHGFIVFDEMKIQGSIQLGDEFEIAGLVDLGEFYHNMRSLQTGGERKAEMATHVFQLAFQGCEGFFFPFAWFPITEMEPINIFLHHWDSVFHLKHRKFFSHACLCDGSQANRDFIMGHFKSPEDAIMNKFSIDNRYDSSSKYSFIMDPPHTVRKLRNNLEKNSLTGTGRSFKFNGKHILWSHLEEAYLHDKTNARAPVTSCKIKDSHFQLTPATRMTNHLAADIFSDNMLELLYHYQEFKRGQEGDADSMALTREYLSVAKLFVKTFADTKPIRTMDDQRLVELDAALQWFLDWREDVMESENQTPKERNKAYISDKLHVDLCSMVLGYKSYVCTMITQFPGMGPVSASTNLVALENMFGCIRASNGSNANPTVLQYGSSVHGYIRCRSFKGRNGNASRK